MVTLISWIGALILAVCPGCWIAFARPDGPRAWRDPVRWAAAIALAPLVLAAEFIAFRLMRVEPMTVVTWLVALNALALPFAFVLSWRRPPAAAPRQRSPRIDFVAYAIVAIVVLVSFGPRLTDWEDRAFSGHAWMHADTCYQLANGSLDPEESLLAGVRQSFPWLGHVYPTVVGLLVDRSPLLVYFWLNLVSLLATAILIAAAARNLSPRPLVGPIAVILLLFGVNVVGFWLARVLPESLVKQFPVFGDPRYTPWLLKYAFFNQMPIAFAAIAVLVERITRRAGRDELPVTVTALACVGLIYPMLAPVAGLLFGVRTIGLLRDEPRRGWAGLVLLGLVTAGSWLYLQHVTAARGDQPALTIASTNAMIRKTGDMALAFAPFVLALVLAGRRSFQRSSMALLLVTLATIAAHIILHMPHWRNEYKFVFGAALCMAPLAAAGLRWPTNNHNAASLSLFALLTTAIASPMAIKAYGHPRWGPTERPAMRWGSFEVESPTWPRSTICPELHGYRVPTIIVADDPPVHFPTLTGAPLYAPLGSNVTYENALEADTPPFGKGNAGLNLEAAYLVNAVRGYDRSLLKRRQRAYDLFRAETSPSLRAQRLAELRDDMGLRRILLLVHPERHPELTAWLSTISRAKAEYRLGDWVFWEVY